MDLGVGGAGGAVACPVCTLYLREGISLQKHLDTHPKEQVIEALIKASVAPPQAQTPLNPSIPPAHNAPQLQQSSPMGSQASYPIGPVFECPPVSTVVPPQFASFSYQQFVNNGTMMIPQYAMAPQANQMMQMLYNPYGMYQQQQIPAVQMITPMATVPSVSRIKPMVSVASETNCRTTTVSLSSDPKQTLPEILSEPERVLPDIEILQSPTPSQEQAPSLHDVNEENSLQPSPAQEEQNGTQHEYQSASEELRMSCDDSDMTEDKSKSVLPEIEEIEALHDVTHHVQKVPRQHEQTQTQQFSQDYESTLGKEGSNEAASQVIHIDTMEDKVENSTPLEHTEQIVTESPQQQAILEKQTKESSQQPEVEQLEQLLITIMESDFDNSSLKDEAKDQKQQQQKEDRLTMERERSVIQQTIVNTQDAQGYQQQIPSSEIQIEESCVKQSTLEQQNDNSWQYVQETNYSELYQYKNSLSAPASPVTQKKPHSYRTYSERSEFGSNENLCTYPVGFEAAALQDDDDDEKNEMDDNFDEEDMEIEEITSPHTPFMRYNENMDCIRSHTPLSAISGISGLRVRTDLSKPCSPVSAHSFHHMNTNSLSGEEETNEMIDPEAEKDPIDCSQLEREREDVIQNETIVPEIFEQTLQLNHMYPQSVITDNVSSFPITHQQPMIIHESYSKSNSKTADNLLDLSERSEPTTSTDSKNFQPAKPIVQKPTTELLNINEDAHAGPMNVFEFDGLQILVPSTFISESSQKAVSATSQQSMASSEGGAGADEEVKTVNMCADETMPPRGELSEQESNGCNEPSAWQLYMGQESSRMSTSYDLMARESWEESEGSDNEIGGPLLDSRSLATHFTSSLFLDRDRKTPTRRMFKCPHCTEVFDCPKERRVHTSTVHKEAGPSSSRDHLEQTEVKDIKLLEGRMNMFDDIFVPTMQVQQSYHIQQPLLHQLQPPQQPDLPKLETDQKLENLVITPVVDITCAICGQQFTSEKTLQMHHGRFHSTEGMKRVRENAKCQTCNEEFPSVVLYNAHLKMHPLECGQCGKYFYRKQNFKLHMKRHLGIKPFPCAVCDKAFLTKQKLDEHTNGHTGNAPVKCNLCNESFRRYSNLTQHKNRHHLNIKKKLKDYICHCGEVFHTKKKLAWHKETHDEKPKACTYCNERFVHMASLTRHMRRAHNRRFVPDAQRENENVECPICKCIYLRSSLSVHMRVHNGERPFECQVCSKAFSTKWNLQLHKWTHAARSTKPFKCNQCSAAFYRHSDYTAHNNSHRNVRPYTCNYCGAQFIRKYNCLRHVKEHEENKAYTCDICNKTFHRSYYLKEHLRVHSGARPYTCHICGKSSSTKSNHNKHVRIHHAREPVNTEN